MSFNPITDAEMAVLSKDDDNTKLPDQQLEYALKSGPEVIVDSEAKNYVDHTVVIDEATNKRLRNLINRRLVVVFESANADPSKSFAMHDRLLPLSVARQGCPGNRQHHGRLIPGRMFFADEEIGRDSYRTREWSDRTMRSL